MLSVAVIGSGVGALSTCYYLKKIFKDKVSIDVFEKNDRIGGRTMPMTVNGHNFELGAAIAITDNKYINNWADEFKLNKCENQSNNFGLWNGQRFTFQESSYSLITLYSLFCRYGYDLISLKSLTSTALSRFNNIYKMQENGIAFETPQELWRSLNLHDYTSVSFNQLMSENLSKNALLTTELLSAINRVNYNQTNELNALAGLVSMMPLVGGKTFSLRDGWTGIHKNVFKLVNNVYLSTPITSITTHHSTSISVNKPENPNLLPTDTSTIHLKYRLHSSVDTSATVEGRRDYYDIVVLATPQHTNQDQVIVVQGSGGSPNPSPAVPSAQDYAHCTCSIPYHEYQQTITTHVYGTLTPAYFAGPSIGETANRHPNSRTEAVTLPDQILLTEEGAKKEKFSSIAKKWEDKATGKAIYKVFSTEALDNSSMSALFSPDSTVLAVQRWAAAYPTLTPTPISGGAPSQQNHISETLPTDAARAEKRRPDRAPELSFKPYANEQIYYVSALEAAVSAMEVSAIAGRNVALLIQRDFSSKK